MRSSSGNPLGEESRPQSYGLDWEEVPLSCLVNLNPDKMDESTSDDCEFDYVDIGNVTLERGIISSERLNFGNAPSRARRRVQKHDVIISTVRTYLKAVARIQEDVDSLIVSTGFAVLRPNENIDPQFLYRLVQSERFVQEIEARSVGVSYPAINANQITKLKVRIPPVETQTIIANFLESKTTQIDALIAKKERLIELLKKKRQASLARAVTKGLYPNVPMKPSGIDWLGHIPEHWKLRAFRYSATIRNGQVDPEFHEYRDLPLIAPNHIESGTGRLLETESAADQAAESGKYLFEEGEVLYSKIRPALAKVCMAPCRGLCSADMYPIKPMPDLQAKFLFYFMLSRDFTNGVVLLSDRVAMPKMNRRDLGAFRIPIPPIAEQVEIVEKLDGEFSKIERLIAKAVQVINKLYKYRSALVTAAVTGQIDVTRYRGEALCQ